MSVARILSVSLFASMTLASAAVARPSTPRPAPAPESVTSKPIAAPSGAPAPVAASGKGLDLNAFLGEQGQAFSQIDSDHNGTVSAKEFADYRTRQQIERTVRQYRALFASLDADHNGVLSIPEFMKLASSVPLRDSAREFAVLDANHDGKLTRSEYLVRMTANFDQLDLNKDGTIDASELARSRQPPPGR